jgi:dihydroflavonol-4-reductase
MKILLTGSTGLLGSNLVRKLAQAGYEVRAIVRESSDLSLLKNTDTEIVTGNLFNTRDIRRALQTCRIVIHAAAHAVQWPTGYEHYRQTNVEATRLLLQESKNAGKERFIYVGSANAFGPGTRKDPGTENTPFTANQFLSGYMRSKYEAQLLVTDFAQDYGFPAVTVNPTFMLGKFDLKPGSGQLIRTAMNKLFMPCPSGGKNFIHVEDVAAGIIQAIKLGKPGESYLLGHENLSYREFFEKMKAVCGYPRHLIPVPRPLIKVAGQAGSFCEKISGKAVPLNAVNANLLSGGNYYSAQKAIRELGLPQTPIEQAIADAVEWFQKR